MKKIVILTLFPNVFQEYFNTSIIKNAIDKKIVEINVVNFREFSKDKHKKVDDTPYGGGAGMVLTLQPIVDAINFYKRVESKVILLTPSGIKYHQKIAKNFSLSNHLIIICGHYEGFDERINNYIDYSISIGDYVLSGGELAAMVLTDSIVRLYDGVISKESLLTESFENNLLDYPVYTKPYEYDQHFVPSVLLSGNHKEIDKFRKEQQLLKTKTNRFDLYLKYKKNIGD